MVVARNEVKRNEEANKKIVYFFACQVPEKFPIVQVPEPLLSFKTRFPNNLKPVF
jgi:hypothetical protein